MDNEQNQQASQPQQSQPTPENQAQPTFPLENDEQQVPASAFPAAEPITWTASEFVANGKTAGWYAGLAGVAIVIAAIVWFLNGKDWFSAVCILAGAVILGVYASRKPRQLTYTVDSTGMMIGEKHFPFTAFRSFSVTPEGAFSSIVFTPMKRLSIPITIYYDPADEERIINLLHTNLPREDHDPDPIERLLRAIRF